MNEKELLEKLWKKGKEFLGVKYPIISGAMTWISDHSLVSAVSEAGGFGVLAGGNSPAEWLAEEIDRVRSLTDKPFGVNLIVIAPNYKKHLEVVKEKKVDFIIFAGNFPRDKEIAQIKETGAKTIAFASNETSAKRLISRGIDALILEGNEAGGHVGYVSLVVLLQQVLFKFRDTVPIFTAGGIATGEMAAHLLLAGASGIQMGTIFAVSKESKAHPKFKERYIKAKAREAVATPQFHQALRVVPVRAIRNKGMERFSELQIELIEKIKRGEISQIEAQYAVEKFWVGALRRAVEEGDIETGSLMAGQSVGLVNKEMSVREIIDYIIEGILKELRHVKNMVCLD
ncbi:MAG: nitronate monooxygenase [Candidatus Aminicenantes bacterium]|nr:nitronate monooxygenase [Candidatus Aminicenantes bacterium]